MPAKYAIKYEWWYSSKNTLSSKTSLWNKMYSRVEVYMYYSRNSLEPMNMQEFLGFSLTSWVKKVLHLKNITHSFSLKCAKFSFLIFR
jgi:hypothetical protein